MLIRKRLWAECEKLRRDNSAYGNRRGVLMGILMTPGLFTTAVYRLRRVLALAFPSLRGLDRILGMLAWSWTTCQLSPSARIGGGFVLPHPVGVIIGDGVSIAKNCKVFQHVTLGRASEAMPAYPRVGEGCIIFANCVVVGRVTLAARTTVKAMSLISEHEKNRGIVAAHQHALGRVDKECVRA